LLDVFSDLLINIHKLTDFAMTKETFSELVPAHMKELSEPITLKGTQIDRIIQHNDLHLTEISMALGVNTAALYSKKSEPKDLQSSVSLLLRLFSAFPDKLPRIPTISLAELGGMIEAIDPSFTSSYSIGPLLGLETNSSYRFTKSGFNKTTQTTKVLAWLIHTLLKENPENWWVIKEVVETEAAARKINPPASVWKQGGWNKYKRNDAQSEKTPQTSSEPSEAPDTAPPSNSIKNKLIRRRT